MRAEHLDAVSQCEMGGQIHADEIIERIATERPAELLPHIHGVHPDVQPGQWSESMPTEPVSRGVRASGELTPASCASVLV